MQVVLSTGSTVYNIGTPAFQLFLKRVFFFCFTGSRMRQMRDYKVVETSPSVEK